MNAQHAQHAQAQPPSAPLVRRRRGTGADSRGTTVVEMALVLPLLILFITGIFDVANMMRISLGIQHAVRMGVALASSGAGVDTDERSVEKIETEVKAQLALLGEKVNAGAAITVTSWPGSNSTGDGTTGDLGGPCDTVEVKVDYNYPVLESFQAAMMLPMFASEEGGLSEIQPTVALSRAERRLNEPWASCN
ncbi:TadE/TadG family type IV pilus assembly protein [Desulfolutivibrio sp.]|uniref:TadE/TadG family type IV pilus assembly protein n=1 Tax=Desulfolutivibrio sp. TaxID=2773296 RepID=UPI002F9652E6